MSARKATQQPADGLREGRTAPSYTDIHDWVALSNVSDGAVRLYVLLCMHINRLRGDNLVWPGTDTLARMMKRSRSDKISALIRELIALGAIEVERVGVPGRYIYTVHRLPPDGYAGAIGFEQWYAQNKPALDEARAAAKVKRDARRKAAKSQVTPVTPDSGEQGQSTQIRGNLSPHMPGELVTPVSGGEPDEVNQMKVNQMKTPTPGTVGAERTARTARARASAASPRVNESSSSRSGRQSKASPAALALLAQLPRPWRECEPWVRQRIAGKLDKALGQYGPAAILWAFQTHGRDPAKVLTAEGRPAGDGETRHLTAMDRVLTLFRKDVQGGACRDCALEHPGRPCGDPLLTLVPGVCIVCDSPDSTARTKLPLQSFVCDPCWATMTADDPREEAA